MLSRTSMINPYQSPKASLYRGHVGSRRYAHVLIALASGLLVLPIVRTLATIAFFGQDSPDLRGNLSFWSSVAIGSLVASSFAKHFKQMPLLVAFLLGPFCVLLFIAGWMLWFYVSAA